MKLYIVLAICFRYAVFTDIDEFIVPKINDSWMAVIDTVDSTQEKHYSTYQFSRGVFEKTWGVQSPYSKNFFIQKYQLSTLLYTKRLPIDIYSPRCICDTRKVKVAGIYKSISYTGKAGHTLIHPDVALLNQYRAWVPGHLKQFLFGIVGVQPRYSRKHARNDHTMLHKGHRVMERVFDRIEKISQNKIGNHMPYVEYKEVIKYESIWLSYPWLKSPMFQ